MVSNPLLSLEMLIVRLLHLKEIPSYADLVSNNATQETVEVKFKQPIEKINKEKGKLVKVSQDQIKSTIQTKPELASLNKEEINIESIKTFEDLIKLSSKKREIELKFDLERNVNLIRFSEGKIDIAFNDREIWKNENIFQ